MQNPLSSLTNRERIGLMALTSALILLGVGSFFYRSTAATLEPTLTRASPTPHLPAPASPTPHPTAPPLIVVYVTGAVRSPGIYSLPSGARLYQAIHKAGGFRKEAQREALNLASFLKDAEQVHIPARGAPNLVPQPIARAVSPVPQPHVTASSNRKLRSPTEGQVNLNTATLEELQKLPGIGPSMAQRILEYRQTNGNFQERIQLKEVRGIGEKTFAKLEPFLTL